MLNLLRKFTCALRGRDRRDGKGEDRKLQDRDNDQSIIASRGGSRVDLACLKRSLPIVPLANEESLNIDEQLKELAHRLLAAAASHKAKSQLKQQGL